MRRAVPVILVKVARADFTPQRRVGFLNEIISDTWTDRDAVVDSRDGIVQSIEAEVSIKSLGKQPVILAEPVQLVGILLAVVCAINSISPKRDFVLPRIP